MPTPSGWACSSTPFTFWTHPVRPERIPASRPWVKEADEYAFYFESDSGAEDRTAFLISEVGAIKPTRRSRSRWKPCNPPGRVDGE